VGAYIVDIRIAILFSAVTIRTNKGMTAFGTIHNFSILLTNSFDKLGIQNIKVNFRTEGFTVLGSELVGIVTEILKGHNVLISREKILKRNPRPLDAGISAEDTAVKVVGKDDVNSHTVKSPFVSFCIYYNPVRWKSQVKIPLIKITGQYSLQEIKGIVAYSFK
jgi:hypothetical protein